jgi:hypothetical protein
MHKGFWLAACYLFAANSWAQATLTPLEIRWLKAGSPVLDYAKTMRLPVDIIVQPEAKPTDVPLAMGFDKGRCKLVLSMRGNPHAETILDPIVPAQRDMIIETMVAHELGHCWRYMHGVWHQLPAGMIEATPPADAVRQPLADELQLMRETRREEGFADLVGLAWTLNRHPAQYEFVYRWLAQLRQVQPTAGSYHDTAVWIQLAKNPAALGQADAPFEQVLPLWKQGLLEQE